MAGDTGRTARAAKTEKEIFLHIGYPRTGTTTLQHNVFVRHGDLAYLGKPLHYLSKKVAAFFSVITERPTLEYERELGRFVEEVVDPLLARKELPKVLISEEELSTGRLAGVDRAVIARRLAELFPEARVLVTLRRQEDVLASLYCHLRAESMIPNVDFASWLEGQRARLALDNVFLRFDYGGLLDTYAELFGEQRIHVQLYEDFARDGAGWLRAFAGFVGVDPERTAALLDGKPGEGRRNRRLTERHLAWIEARRRVRRLPSFDRLEDTRAGRLVRAWLDRGPAIDVEYRQEQRAFVRELYAGGNARVASRFRVDLAGHDYAHAPAPVEQST